MLFALVTGIVDGAWLQPGNFAAQFIEISDELAGKRVRDGVQEICDGRLSPDTDARQAWTRFLQGQHAEGSCQPRPPRER
jgi:hypothetical protein